MSSLSWLDPGAPKSPSSCYIPKRHRGFFRSQLYQLNQWDRVMKEMKSAVEEESILHFDPETGHSQWQCQCLSSLNHGDRHSGSSSSGSGSMSSSSSSSSSSFHYCPCFIEGQLHGGEYRKHHHDSEIGIGELENQFRSISPLSSGSTGSYRSRYVSPLERNIRFNLNDRDHEQNRNNFHVFRLSPTKS